jgi:hypothetical protein
MVFLERAGIHMRGQLMRTSASAASSEENNVETPGPAGAEVAVDKDGRAPGSKKPLVSANHEGLNHNQHGGL